MTLRLDRHVASLADGRPRGYGEGFPFRQHPRAT
jgi:hypothetical protein